MSSADGTPEGLPVPDAEQAEEATDAAQPSSSTSGEPTTDEEVAPAQVEATDQAAEAEGHGEQTSSGSVAGPVEQPPAEEPAEAAPPADPTAPESSDELRLGLLDVFKQELGEGVVGAHIRDGDDLWVRVTTEAWRESAQIARGKLGCTAFCYLSAIDWMPSPWGRSEDSPLDVPIPAEARAPMTFGYAGGETRFQMLARVQNPATGHGVTLKADVGDPEVGVPSWIPVFAGANWHEREAWEMYGIFFIGHPHLIHLYLPGGFEGNPLRKDFPLLPRLVKPWPGIVDVEPMPAGEDAEEEADAETAPAENVPS